MGSAIPAIGNVVLDGHLNLVDPNVEFGNYHVIKETTWAQTEFGYKGQVSDNMTIAVDVYQMNISDYVSNLHKLVVLLLWLLMVEVMLLHYLLECMVMTT